MSPTDGSRFILASATKDGQLVQSTTSIVPSKRKVYDENLQPQESFNSTLLEGSSGYESFAFGDDRADRECCRYLGYTDEDLDQAHIAILRDEDAVRAEAELSFANSIVSRVERGFDEDEELFQECHGDHYDDNVNLVCKDDVQRTRDDMFFGERIRSDEMQLMDLEFQNGLCCVCRAVRWYALARLSLTEPHLIYQRTGSPLKLQISQCRLCELLGWTVIGKSSSADLRDGACKFDLSICPSQREGTKILVVSLTSETQQSLITLHSLAGNKGWSPCVIDPETINFDTLRKMFARCCRKHTKRCRPKPGIQLSAFKVIHCNSRKVVAAPAQCKYVALSYVWGDYPKETISEKPTIQFPATIEDSCRVTKEMGYEYLWVDQYVRILLQAVKHADSFSASTNRTMPKSIHSSKIWMKYTPKRN